MAGELLCSFVSILVAFYRLFVFCYITFTYMSFIQVATGRLLKKWHAHYRAVSCLVYVDQTTLISGAEDGCVRVWSLLMYSLNFF